MCSDSLHLAGFGSLLKLLALIPLFFAVLDCRRLRVRLRAETLLPLCFWLLAALSLTYTIQEDMTLTSLKTMSLNLLLVLVLGGMERYSRRETELLLKSLICGGWLVVVLMLLFSDVSLDGRLTFRLSAGTQDQNYINGYILFAYTYHFDSFVKTWKKTQLLLAAGLFIVVLMTGSRGALAAYLLTTLCEIVFGLRRAGRGKGWAVALPLVLAGIVLLYLCSAALPDEVAIRYSWKYLMQHGATGRIQTWTTLLRHYAGDNVGRMLFGHGYGTTQIVNSYNAHVAHNLYLDNLISLGAVGAAMQIAIQCLYACRLGRQREGSSLFWMYIGLIGMCFSLSLTSYRPIWNTMLMTLILMNGEGGRAAPAVGASCALRKKEGLF